MKKDDLLNEEFLKQFKDSKDFSHFIDKLYKRGIESMLQGEIEAHLGYSKNRPKPGPSTTNARNGYSKKVVKTDRGALEIAVPRDRNAEFEPDSADL